MLVIAAQVLLFAAIAQPGTDALDGMLVDSAEIPSSGTFRIAARTQASSPVAPPSEGDVSSPAAYVSASALWAFASSVAAGFAASNEGGRLTPSVNLRWQMLFQEAAPMNVTGLLRFKSIGFQSRGSELEASLNVGRRLGDLSLVANAVVGKGFAGEAGLDVEGKMGAHWVIVPGIEVGPEARLRTELAFEEGSTATSSGREYDFIAGPSAVWRVDAVYLQAMAGWSVPRGTGSAGPMGALALAFDY